MNDEETANNIYKKIEREKALINAANLMRQQTNNDAVRSKLDREMREGRRNLEFFEEKLSELQMRRLGQGMDTMSLAADRPQSADMSGDGDGDSAPPLPPKDGSQWAADRSSYGSASYGPGQGSGTGPGDVMPPRQPFAAPPPNAVSKPRPNFTKLGMCKSPPPKARQTGPTQGGGKRSCCMT